MRPSAAGVRFATALFVAVVLVQTSRAAPSKDWIRIVTPHFSGEGNASAKDLASVLDELEQLRGAISRIAPALTRAQESTDVVLLKDQSGFQPFQPLDERGRHIAGVGGFYTEGAFGNHFVLPDYWDAYTKVAAYHEYVHALLHRTFHVIPTWVDEGVAEFYSTFQIDRKKNAVRIGMIPPDAQWTLRHETLVPLRDIVTERGAANNYVRRERIGMFYAESWGFVHFLVFSNHQQRSGQLFDYVAALSRGESEQAAFGHVFGASYEALDKQLREYLKGSLIELQINFSGPPDQGARPQYSPVPLTVADAESLQAMLLSDNGSWKDAERHVKAALSDDPHTPAAVVAAARTDMQAGRVHEALDGLEGAAVQAPGSYAIAYELGEALMEAGRYEEAMTALSRATTLRRTSEFAWLELSTCALALHRDAQANATLSIALELDSNPSLWRGRAERAFAVGRFDVAAADVDRFLAQHGIYGDDAGYAAFVGAIALRRIQRPADADRLLADVSPALDQHSWAENVLLFLQGKVGPADFLARAHDTGQKTEAHAYLGFAALQDGHPGEARKHFEWVRDSGNPNYSEYPLAIAELGRLTAAGS